MERKLELVEQIIEHSKADKQTGIPLIDNNISDYKGYSRMWTEEEKNNIIKEKKAA